MNNTRSALEIVATHYNEGPNGPSNLDNVGIPYIQNECANIWRERTTVHYEIKGTDVDVYSVWNQSTNFSIVPKRNGGAHPLARAITTRGNQHVINAIPNGSTLLLIGSTWDEYKRIFKVAHGRNINLLAQISSVDAHDRTRHQLGKVKAYADYIKASNPVWLRAAAYDFIQCIDAKNDSGDFFYRKLSDLPTVGIDFLAGFDVLLNITPRELDQVFTKHGVIKMYATTHWCPEALLLENGSTFRNNYLHVEWVKTSGRCAMFHEDGSKGYDHRVSVMRKWFDLNMQPRMLGGLHWEHKISCFGYSLLEIAKIDKIEMVTRIHYPFKERIIRAFKMKLYLTQGKIEFFYINAQKFYSLVQYVSTLMENDQSKELTKTIQAFRSRADAVTVGNFTISTKWDLAGADPFEILEFCLVYAKLKYFSVKADVIEINKYIGGKSYLNHFFTRHLEWFKNGIIRDIQSTFSLFQGILNLMERNMNFDDEPKLLVHVLATIKEVANDVIPEHWPRKFYGGCQSSEVKDYYQEKYPLRIPSAYRNHSAAKLCDIASDLFTINSRVMIFGMEPGGMAVALCKATHKVCAIVCGCEKDYELYIETDMPIISGKLEVNFYSLPYDQINEQKVPLDSLYNYLLDSFSVRSNIVVVDNYEPNRKIDYWIKLAAMYTDATKIVKLIDTDQDTLEKILEIFPNHNIELKRSVYARALSCESYAILKPMTLWERLIQPDLERRADIIESRRFAHQLRKKVDTAWSHARYIFKRDHSESDDDDDSDSDSDDEPIVPSTSGTKVVELKPSTPVVVSQAPSALDTAASGVQQATSKLVALSTSAQVALAKTNSNPIPETAFVPSPVQPSAPPKVASLEVSASNQKTDPPVTATDSVQNSVSSGVSSDVKVTTTSPDILSGTSEVSASNQKTDNSAASSGGSTIGSKIVKFFSSITEPSQPGEGTPNQQKPKADISSVLNPPTLKKEKKVKKDKGKEKVSETEPKPKVEKVSASQKDNSDPNLPDASTPNIPGDPNDQKELGKNDNCNTDGFLQPIRELQDREFKKFSWDNATKVESLYAFKLNGAKIPYSMLQVIHNDAPKLTDINKKWSDDDDVTLKKMCDFVQEIRNKDKTILKGITDVSNNTDTRKKEPKGSKKDKLVQERRTGLLASDSDILSDLHDATGFLTLGMNVFDPPADGDCFWICLSVCVYGEASRKEYLLQILLKQKVITSSDYAYLLPPKICVPEGHMEKICNHFRVPLVCNKKFLSKFKGAKNYIVGYGEHCYLVCTPDHSVMRASPTMKAADVKWINKKISGDGIFARNDVKYLKEWFKGYNTGFNDYTDLHGKAVRNVLKSLQSVREWLTFAVYNGAPGCGKSFNSVSLALEYHFVHKVPWQEMLFITPNQQAQKEIRIAISALQGHDVPELLIKTFIAVLEGERKDEVIVVPNGNMKYLFIDEYSRYAFELIWIYAALFPNAKIIFFGDIEQMGVAAKWFPVKVMTDIKDVFNQMGVSLSNFNVNRVTRRFGPDTTTLVKKNFQRCEIYTSVLKPTIIRRMKNKSDNANPTKDLMMTVRSGKTAGGHELLTVSACQGASYSRVFLYMDDLDITDYQSYDETRLVALTRHKDELVFNLPNNVAMVDVIGTNQYGGYYHNPNIEIGPLDKDYFAEASGFIVNMRPTYVKNTPLQRYTTTSFGFRTSDLQDAIGMPSVGNLTESLAYRAPEPTKGDYFLKEGMSKDALLASETTVGKRHFSMDIIQSINTFCGRFYATRQTAKHQRQRMPPIWAMRAWAKRMAEKWNEKIIDQEKFQKMLNEVCVDNAITESFNEWLRAMNMSVDDAEKTYNQMLIFARGHLKQQCKVKGFESAFKNKEGQPIVASSKQLNMVICLLIRIMAKLWGLSVRDDIILADRLSEAEIYEKLQPYFDQIKGWFMMDMPSFDSTQGFYTHFLDHAILYNLCPDPELLDLFYIAKMNCKFFSPFIVCFLIISRYSGYPDTMTGNMIINTWLFVVIYDGNQVIVAVFKGDDSGIGVNCLRIYVVLDMTEYNRVFNAALKISYHPTVLEFCNCLFDPSGYCYNPYCLAGKILNKTYTDVVSSRAKWSEYMDSFAPFRAQYTSDFHGCAQRTAQWYLTSLEWSERLIAILLGYMILSYEQAFSALGLEYHRMESLYGGSCFQQPSHIQNSNSTVSQLAACDDSLSTSTNLDETHNSTITDLNLETEAFQYSCQMYKYLTSKSSSPSLRIAEHSTTSTQSKLPDSGKELLTVTDQPKEKKDTECLSHSELTKLFNQVSVMDLPFNALVLDQLSWSKSRSYEDFANGVQKQMLFFKASQTMVLAECETFGDLFELIFKYTGKEHSEFLISYPTDVEVDENFLSVLPTTIFIEPIPDTRVTLVFNIAKDMPVKMFPWSIDEVKKAVFEKFRIPPEAYYLKFGQKMIIKDKDLEEFFLRTDPIDVQIIFRGPGGAKGLKFHRNLGKPKGKEKKLKAVENKVAKTEEVVAEVEKKIVKKNLKGKEKAYNLVGRAKNKQIEGLTGIQKALMKALSLPSKTQPVRVQTGLQATRTASGSTFKLYKPSFFNNNEMIVFIFPDTLRNVIMWDKNSTASPYSYSFKFLPYASDVFSNADPTDSFTPESTTIEPTPIPVAFALSTEEYSPHDDILSVADFNGAKVVWLESGTIVSWVWTDPSHSSNYNATILFSKFLKGAMSADIHQQTKLINSTASIGDFWAIPSGQEGYYSFKLSTSILTASLSLSEFKFGAASGVWKHLAAPSINDNLGNITNARVNACSFLFQSIGKVLDQEGKIGFRQNPKGSMWTDFAARNYEQISNLKGFEDGKAMNGGYGFVKPVELDELNFKSESSETNGSLLNTSYSLIPDRPFIVAIISVEDATDVLFNLKISTHLEFYSENQLFEYRLPSADLKDLEAVLKKIGKMPLYYENPTHENSIMAAIRGGINKALDFAKGAAPYVKTGMEIMEMLAK